MLSRIAILCSAENESLEDSLMPADPRILHREKGDNYLTGGHYGVVPWDSPTGTVSSSAGCDNGRWSVADPRMPEQDQKVITVIRTFDGAWHRPFHNDGTGRAAVIDGQGRDIGA